MRYLFLNKKNAPAGTYILFIPVYLLPFIIDLNGLDIMNVCIPQYWYVNLIIVHDRLGPIFAKCYG